MWALSRVVVLCLLLSFAAVGVFADGYPLPPCTEDDIVIFYTPCSNLSSTRTLYTIYKNSCTSTTALPEPVSGFPCDIDCDPGQYLPFGALQCEPCEAGTFSLGGGVRIYNWEEQLPYDTYYYMGTYCMDPSTYVVSPKCSGWTPNGAYISTDLKGLSEVAMVLEAPVYFTETGAVEFEYSATSEHEEDFLLFEVDTFEIEGKISMVLPTTAEPRVFSYTIDVNSPKWIILRWAYTKNPVVSMGEGFASINYIDIYGMLRSDDRCTPCTAGRYQELPGKDYCDFCEANTYSNDPDGAATCTDCPAGEYSFPGSPSCE